jgi:hypothetical protein
MRHAQSAVAFVITMCPELWFRHRDKRLTLPVIVRELNTENGTRFLNLDLCCIPECWYCRGGRFHFQLQTIDKAKFLDLYLCLKP